MKVSENFTLDELLSSATAKRMNYTEQFNPPIKVVRNLSALVKNVLQPLRESLGKPITITSGYRCERLNKRVKGAKNSQHVLGQAADLKIDGMTTEEIVKHVIKLDLPFDQIIEEFGDWVHISHDDTKNRKQALRAVKRNMRTLYLPFK